MQNRNDLQAQVDVDTGNGHSSLMGRDILAAAVLTVAAAVCIAVAWNGGAAVDPSRSGAPATEISAHQRPSQ